MSSTGNVIHFGSCQICEQGLLRPVRCSECDAWAVLCDECEAIWSDPRKFKDQKPDGQHPVCPHCSKSVEKWKFPNYKQIVRYGLEKQVIGGRPTK